MKKRYTLSIDPSINFLGWAIFDEKKLVKYGLLTPKVKSSDYLVKCREMVVNINTIVATHCPLPKIHSNNYFDYAQLVVEVPDHFATAGFMSRESGAVQKLTFLAGMIYNMAPDTIGYFPRVWKGNIPKHMCALRLAKLSKHYEFIFFGKPPYKKVYCKDCDVDHYPIILRHDIIDAIGLAHKFLFGKI